MFRYIFLLLFLTVPLNLYPFPENAEFRVSDSTEGYSRKRVYIKDGDFRLSLVDAEKNGEPYRSLSFVSPYAGLGKLKPKGIFAEIMNPCGYGPTSPVFTEEGKLAFDKGMTESGRYGLYVKPFGNLSFFMLGTQEEPEIRGLHLAAGDGILHGEFLYGNSDPCDEEKSSFYLDRTGHFEGCQLNSFMLKLEAETEYFIFSSATSVSSGKYMENGLYNREYASFYFYDLAEISFLFSLCTGEYLAPGCRPSSSGYVYGISAGLYPVRNFSITGSVETDSGMPDYKDYLCNDFSVGSSVKAEWEMRGFRLKAAAEKVKKTENTGKESEKSSILSSASYGNDYFYMVLSYKRYFEDSAETRNTADCSIRFYPGNARCTLKWKRDIGEEIKDTLSQEFMLVKRDFELTVSHSRETGGSSIISVSAEISY